jgi:ferritin-like protein
VVEIYAAPITNLTQLRDAVQNAIQLEHATIPPYLTAYYTLSGASPSVNYAKRLIRGIVNQEMLHMALACNILNAIGGAPRIADPSFIPTYPGRLPMGVEASVEIHLKRYSRDLVEQTFMSIEEPEVPLHIPVKPALFTAVEIRTIGQFYSSIRAELVRQGDPIFTGGSDKQAIGALGATAVTNVNTAVSAINTIVEQGEGTPTSPAGMANTVAHYYRFQELAKGMKIVSDPASPLGFSFDPRQPITIDDNLDVIQMVDDPQLVSFEGTAAQLADACDVAYSDLLRILHEAFNGMPNKIDEAIDQMTGVLDPAITNVLGVQMTAGPHNGQYAGARFKYIV